MIKDVEIIITGGTIDSEWNPFGDNTPPREKRRVTMRSRSGIKPYIERYIKPDFEIFENVVALVDSSDMTDELFEKVIKGIANAKSKNVLITHGTDNLAEFSRRIEKNIRKFAEKKVIILGGLYPLVGSMSDAPFNLGYSISAVEHVTPGVYVAMNAQLFKPGNVEKDFEKGRFIRINDTKNKI